MDKTDSHLENGVRIALRMFGEGILGERRLIGVLLDYQAFQNFDSGEYIVKTLIEDDTLKRLATTCKVDNINLFECVCRETGRINRQYGFSETYVERVLRSFISGMMQPEWIKENYKPFSPSCEVQSSNYPEKANKKDSPSHKSIQNSSSSTKNTSGKSGNTIGTKKALTEYDVAAIIFLAIVIFFCVVAVKYTVEKNKRQTNPYESILYEAKDEQMDTIVTAPDDTILYRRKKTKPYPKGRWKESDAYEAAYEDGYEDGLNDTRFHRPERSEGRSNNLRSTRKGVRPVAPIPHRRGK